MDTPTTTNTNVNRMIDTCARIAEALVAGIEAEVRASAAAVAKVDAQPLPAEKLVIRFAGRRNRRTVPAYVSAVSFKDGDGYGISKIRYTDDVRKAHWFKADMGRAVARQLAGSFRLVAVELVDAKITLVR